MSDRTPGQINSLKAANNARKQSGHRKASAATGYIEAGESFSMEGFIERLGTTRSGVSEMRRRGLIVRKDGGRVRILGADYLKYLASLPVAGLDEDDETEGIESLPFPKQSAPFGQDVSSIVELVKTVVAEVARPLITECWNELRAITQGSQAVDPSRKGEVHPTGAMEFLTTEELADKLKVTTRYLIGLRNDQTPGGPPFIKTGRLIRYRVKDIEEWVKRNTFRY